LNQRSGLVELVNAEGQVLDHVAWGKGQGDGVNLGRGGVHEAFIAGTSVGRYPLSVKVHDFLEWLPFEQPDVTPGAPNPNPRVDVLLPIDGAYFSQPSIKLGWYPVAGAKGYRVQIGTDAAFTQMVEEETAPKPSFKTSDLKPGDYFWRVQAVFGDDSMASFSPPSTFTISNTELPTVSSPASHSFIPNAYAADMVRPRREAVLEVPLIYQHKDTAMLLLESLNESGPHAWDKDHGELDEDDPADNMDCALASTAMVNHFAGGKMSQDRLGYVIRKEVWPDNPAMDLNYGHGLELDQIDTVLSFAFNGATVTRHEPADRNAFWEAMTREIDANRPVVIRVPKHAIVVTGYYEFALTGPMARFVTINDPWSGRYLANVSNMRQVTHYWLVSDTSNPKSDEATITQDSDGDGIVDFDETDRFKTLAHVKDSDHDKVEDKIDVYAGVFDPDYGYATWRLWSISRDRDNDKKFMELDPDSDGGGCKDGEEDKNQNGKRDGGDTNNWDEDDDKCDAGPLGGKVKMTYAYAATRRAACTGTVEINTRFILNPVKAPEAPNIIHVYKADEMTYDIKTAGCADYPGDHLLYTFDKGLHLSGTLPLTEENLGFAMFFPAYPKFSMQLPYELTDMSGVNRLKGQYTTLTGGGPWPAETSVVFEPLSIESEPAYCADPNDPMHAQPDKLDFCTEPTPCADQPNAPQACFLEPQRYYVLPFRKSFHWDTPGDEPGDHYHIADVDVTVEICEGCGEEDR